MPARHRPHPRPIPGSQLAPHLLSMAIALMAVIALPLCLPHTAATALDADERTITESRDVVEIVTTPGVHLLHHAANTPVLAAATTPTPCATCAEGIGTGGTLGTVDPGEPRLQPDDLLPRVAILPALAGIDDANRAFGAPPSDPARPGMPHAAESPPPRIAIA